MPERVKAARIIAALRYNLNAWATQAGEVAALCPLGSDARREATHLELNLRQALAAVERLAAMGEDE